MNKIITFIFSLAISVSCSYAATDDFINVKTVNSYSAKGGDILSAQLTELSPQAIEMGLREAEIIANSKYDSKQKILTIEWHSIAKEVKGTKLSENFDSPLVSKVKLADQNQVISARQKLVASGDIEGVVNAYNRLLSKAKEEIEVDASKELTTNTENDYSNKNGGSNSGGYLSGDNGGLSESNQNPDVEITTDEIQETTEQCSLFVDLNAGLVREQYRTIKTSTNTGNIVERGACENGVNAYPIRKDFEAGCSVKLDNATGTYQKGFKLYSMVEGSRYDISECEWESENGVTYDVFKDFDSCPTDKAVLNVERGTYKPAFVKYTTISGERFNLSDCVTSDTEIKNLPTRTEMCENYNDYTTSTSYTQTRIDTYDPDFKTVLKSSDCANNGETFAIERDFDVASCPSLPNYINAKLYRGFQHYYTKEGKKEYIGNCQNDMDNPVDIFQSVSECSPLENLTDKVATIKKRWFYVDETTGSQQYITDCLESDETYDIVTTQESCSPEYLADINRVIIKNREGWKDSTDSWHFVSECRASGEEADIEVEICDSPKYEHDFVGGQSYLRSRDYYMHNGERQYISNCSRDTTVSFPHTASSSGCTTQHDDTNLRSRVFTKTLAQLEEGITELRGCEASNSYIPYVYLNMSLDNWNVLGGRNYRDYNPIKWSGSIKSGKYACDFVKSQYSGFTYNTISQKEAYLQFTFYHFRATAKTYNKNYRRADGSVYKQTQQKRCYISGIDPNIGGVNLITLP